MTSSNLASGDVVVFLVGHEAIHARRDALRTNNAYFRRFFRAHHDCDEVRLHHTRYAAAEAALRLCECGQDDAFFRLCRRVHEAGEERARLAPPHRRTTRDARAARQAAMAALDDADREHRRRFKDVLSLVENCTRYGLDWHADRACRAACAQLQSTPLVLLALHTSLSLTASLPDLPELVALALSERQTSRTTTPPPAPALTLLCACLRHLSALGPAPLHLADDKSQTQWDALCAEYPVLTALLERTEARHLRSPAWSGHASVARHALTGLDGCEARERGTRTPAPSLTSASPPFPDAEELRVSRLLAQLQPMVRTQERRTAQCAEDRARALATLRGAQNTALERSLAEARTSLASLAARVNAQTQLQASLSADLAARQEAWRAQRDHLDDVQIYTAALRTAAEETEALVVSSTAALRAESQMADGSSEDVVRACVALYEARAHALRQSREITLRRIAAEEAEQEEREMRLSALEQRRISS